MAVDDRWTLATASGDVNGSVTAPTVDESADGCQLLAYAGDGGSEAATTDVTGAAPRSATDVTEGGAGR